MLLLGLYLSLSRSHTSCSARDPLSSAVSSLSMFSVHLVFHLTDEQHKALSLTDRGLQNVLTVQCICSALSATLTDRVRGPFIVTEEPKDTAPAVQVSAATSGPVDGQINSGINDLLGRRNVQSRGLLGADFSCGEGRRTVVFRVPRLVKSYDVGVLKASVKYNDDCAFIKVNVKASVTKSGGGPSEQTELLLYDDGVGR